MTARTHRVPCLVAAALLAAWLAAGPAVGQTVTDGDSLQIGTTRYRLVGIDAPELDQLCPDGWPAGVEARHYLEQLVDGKKIRCVRLYGERNGQLFALCRADGVDLGSAMVVAGQAFAFIPYSARYIAQEAVAARMGRGVHGHGCLAPWRRQAQFGR